MASDPWTPIGPPSADARSLPAVRFHLVGQMSLNTVHTLFCCDLGYAQHLCVAIISMLENNPDSQFDIVVVTREDFGETAQRLERSVARYRNFDLRFEVFNPPKDLK